MSEKRTRTLNIRVTEQEEKTIQKNAGEADCGVSTYVRERALKKNSAQISQKKRIGAMLCQLVNERQRATDLSEFKAYTEEWSEQLWQSLR